MRSTAALCALAGALCSYAQEVVLKGKVTDEKSGEPLIGVNPSDPYGALVAQPFRDAGIELRHSMRGRFAQTVVSLVRHGLGVALIDAFSVAEVYMPGLVRRPLAESAPIRIFVARKKGRILSTFAETAIQQFRRELVRSVRDWDDGALQLS